MESEAYWLILNLHKIAVNHEKYCEQHDCGISIRQVYMAARKLAVELAPEELKEIDALVWPL